MLKLMLFPLPNTTALFRHIAARLTTVSASVIVSDMPDADVNLMPDFYRALQRSDLVGKALADLGPATCDEVVARCRVLRLLDPALARRMVGAAWVVISAIFDREMPDLVLSFIVDRYLLDLVERAARRRGIAYVGLTLAVTPHSMMFMARGEYTPLREPSESEVDRTITMLGDRQFVPWYVRRDSRYSATGFLRLYAYLTARWVIFEGLARLQQNRLVYRYLQPASGEAGTRMRLRDWRGARRFSDDWRSVLERVRFERRVFMALQLAPEASIDYWLPLPFIDAEAVFERAARVLTHAGFTVFVKDHPLEFGSRRVEFVDRLSRYRGVTFVPYDVPAPDLIDTCKACFTLTGSVGLQAAIARRCAIVAASAYYAVPDGFALIRGLEDIQRLPSFISDFVPPADEQVREIVRHVLRACVPGALPWKRFSSENTNCVKRAAPLVASLDRYLPVFRMRARRAPADHPAADASPMTRRFSREMTV